jgi:hypothetical protein
MILSIDRSEDGITASLRGSRSREGVVVAPQGIYERQPLDSALVAMGAGCAPGHTAELRVAWLEAALGPDTTGTWDDGLLDADGEWLAAPIAWAPTPGFGTYEQGLVLLSVTTSKPIDYPTAVRVVSVKLK